MDIKIVIGANYGDEGKGVTTQYLCKKHNASNIILSHGGMQRGHTIHLDMSRKHVHHAFSSGTFFGSDTTYGKQFIVNPHVLCKELQDLRMAPKIHVHKQCRFSTIYDMMINCIIEENRKDKFGTVGIGVWETVKRYEYGKSVSLYDFLKFTNLKKMEYLDSLKAYAMDSLTRHSINVDKLDWGNIFKNIDHFRLLEDFYTLEEYVTFYDDYASLNDEHECVIFENSQGLMLDYFVSKDYNFSTPSRTGLYESMNIIKDMKNVESIEAYYVTRPYITRHGYGPLKNEVPYERLSKYVKASDETNVTNMYQGKFRYSLFDEEQIFRMFVRIERDMSEFSKNFNIKKNLVITHCDEMPPDKIVEGSRSFSFDNTILLENGEYFYSTSPLNRVFSVQHQ